MKGGTRPIAFLVWLAAAGTAAAQDVTLAVTRAGCGPATPPLVAPYRNKEEREHVTAAWIAADRLQVEAWDDETAEDIVDGDSATATVVGHTLSLSYAHRHVSTLPQQRIPACLFAARLSFVISGLARASYRVHVEGHEVVAVDG